MFNRLTNLILKEFYALFQDKQSRMQLLMMPIVMLFVFSFAMTMEVRNSALGVLNEDAGDLGRRFVAMFASGPTFSRVLHLEGNADIRRAVDTQKAE